MCTILLAYQVVENWPIIVGNNRDECFSRLAIAPRVFTGGGSNHWIAPFDTQAGGSWWACSQKGLLVFLTNRWNGLPPDEGKISRGRLVYDLIQHDSPAVARRWLLAADMSCYNPFNLLVLNASGGFMASNYPVFEEFPLSPGFHFIGNGCLGEERTPKSRMARRQFDRWRKGMVVADDIMLGFKRMLCTPLPQESIPPQGFNVRLDGYGTTSSTLLALSGSHRAEFFCLYAAGNPLRVPYRNYAVRALLC